MQIDLDELEYRISREFRHMSPPSRSLWCDGLIPMAPDDGNSDFVEGKIWLGGFTDKGATYQEAWTFVIRRGDTRTADVPPDNAHGWLAVDWSTQRIEITL